MKKHIITIAGKPGSGKSSTANILAEKLGYKRASTGDFMRQIAIDRGMSLDELTKLSKDDKSVDVELDEYNKKIANEENIILDARLGFYFIPESFKIFLEIDHKVAAKRILLNTAKNPLRKSEARYEFTSEESVAKSIDTRLAIERIRYANLYGIDDHTAHENFDLVINTSAPEYDEQIEKVVEKIQEEYEKWLQK